MQPYVALRVLLGKQYDDAEEIIMITHDIQFALRSMGRVKKAIRDMYDEIGKCMEVRQARLDIDC